MRTGRPSYKNKDYSGYYKHAKQFETKLRKEGMSIAQFVREKCPELSWNQFSCQLRGTTSPSDVFKRSVLTYLFNDNIANLTEILDQTEPLLVTIERYIDIMEDLAKGDEDIIEYTKVFEKMSKNTAKWIRKLKRKIKAADEE